MKILIGLALLLIANSALAGSKIIGNGGDVFVCNEGKDVILLDFWEAEVLRNQKLAEPAGEIYQEMLASVLEKLSPRFPRMVQDLNYEVTLFELSHSKIPNISLVDIDDSFNKLVPSGCYQAQAANQSDFAHFFPGDPWFILSEDLWKLMQPFHQTGLVMHEVLYRIGLRYGVEYSKGVRILVSYLFQENFESISDLAWINVFKESRFPYFELGNVRIPIFSGGMSYCEHIPGIKDCNAGESFLSFNKFGFENGKDLYEVDFVSGAQSLEFQTASGVDADVLTHRAVFDRAMSSDRGAFAAEGILRIVLKDQSDAQARSFFAKGSFFPLSGEFDGTVREASKSGRKAHGKERKFKGNLRALLAR